jgi:hypothetical protein
VYARRDGEAACACARASMRAESRVRRLRECALEISARTREVVEQQRFFAS